MTKEKKLKWEPTPKLKHPDGIKSSDYSNTKPFVPSYEHEGRPAMGKLLSMEYARIWQREREQLDQPATQDTSYLPKKFVIRGLNKNKQNMKKDIKKIQPKTKPK